MAITTSMATGFKLDLFQAVHDFQLSGGDTFNFALYTSSATLDATTTAYSATNEVSGTGYTAKGEALTRIDPTTSGTTAYTDFADVSWAASTITARGGGIFNDTETTPTADPWVSAHDFGGDVSSSSGTFTVQFPTADASNAILRIA